MEGDGSLEVIAATYSLVILDAVTGTLERRIDPPGDRQWPSLVVADLEGDGDQEIVTAHGDGYLNVYSHTGSLVWSRQPTPGSELRSLAAYDLDADDDLEIIVAATRSQATGPRRLATPGTGSHTPDGSLTNHQSRSRCGRWRRRAGEHPEILFNLGSTYAKLNPPRKAEALQMLKGFEARACKSKDRSKYQDQCEQAMTLEQKLKGAGN